MNETAKLDNRGYLFKNKRKNQVKQPDLNGKITINGKEYSIGAWEKENADGEIFWSLALSEPYVNTNPNSNNINNNTVNNNTVNKSENHQVEQNNNNLSNKNTNTNTSTNSTSNNTSNTHHSEDSDYNELEKLFGED